MTSFFWGTITWPEMGKQNIQAKKYIKEELRRRPSSKPASMILPVFFKASVGGPAGA